MYFPLPHTSVSISLVTNFWGTNHRITKPVQTAGVLTMCIFLGKWKTCIVVLYPTPVVFTLYNNTAMEWFATVTYNPVGLGFFTQRYQVRFLLIIISSSSNT